MLIVALATLLTSNSHRPSLYHPLQLELAASYREADTIGRKWAQQCRMLTLSPSWIDGGKAFWYRKDEPNGKSKFVKVSSQDGNKSPLFDANRLAIVLGKELGETFDGESLPLRSLSVEGKVLKFQLSGRNWTLNLEDYKLEKGDRVTRSTKWEEPWRQSLWPAEQDPATSPDGHWVARIDHNNVVVRKVGGTEIKLTTDGTASAYYARIEWTADSKRLEGIRVHPGDRKEVYLIQSTPPTWGPAKLLQRVYDRPGDRVDTFDVVTLDPAQQMAPVCGEPVLYGDLPYLRPTTDGAYTYDVMDRGYGRWRVFRLDPQTGKTTTLIDEHPKTFVDSTALIQEYCKKTNEIIYSSEESGWHQLYLADGKGGHQPITKGAWVVRGVTKIDEDLRQIVFTASGVNAGEDPYFVHYYRINFDGSGLIALTPAEGNHQASISPDGETLVDTYSTVVKEPVHELRSAKSGSLIATLEKADVSELRRGGWRAPQPFVAKGRDGKTDIYGVVFRPLNFNPKLRYPIVEDIYAGPQDSFVPKSFSPNFYNQRVADLGFIVVQIDGMGTRNRSKAFHDVCYKNLADAGFPDRIAWMKSLAKVEPAVDITRVGVFGTSAGGQNAAGALLFHPDFYKVGVASCGCHDNRLDKIWWNEQWMGLIGPQYAASSNIENASKLQGDLLLMVGELDTNVPPESTYRFAAALQSAGKEYDLVIIPNSDHTSGGVYGERKRRDFLVKHLLSVDPPNPNR